LSALIAGCAPKEDSYTELTSEEQDTVQAMGLHFDDALKGTRERKLVAMDLTELAHFDLRFPAQGMSADSWFEAIFGGSDTANVMAYLRDRLHVVLSAKVPLDHRMQVARLQEDAVLMASNEGVSLWWTSEILWRRKHQHLALDVGGGNHLRVRSTRDGIVRLGSGYSDAIQPLDRIGTLIHEARHSDCVGGLSMDDLNQIALGRLPRNLQCGNLHSICAAGHAYEGIAACDSIPWGAYAIEGVFLVRVANGCANCSETDRQSALIDAADRFSRIDDVDSMLGGSKGGPDMVSRGVY
jgi:hypothetical protein